MTVHSTSWLRKQPIGATAAQLWKRGFAFDYVSDRQLQRAGVQEGGIQTDGGRYRVVLVPPCKHMSVETLNTLRNLSADGATVVFEKRLPDDVPGLARLDERREALRRLFNLLKCPGVPVNGRAMTRPTACGPVKIPLAATQYS